jgi:peptide/nickel transport system substrate-binding protein
LFAEWPLIVYHLAAEGTASFSGPYEVASFTPDQTLDLKPNPYFLGAEQRSEVIVRKFDDAQAMALAFEAGSLDLAFGLPTEEVSRLKAHADLIVKGFTVGYQYMAWFNLHHTVLADPRVRLALDLAFDRQELAAAVNNGEPATGAYAPYFPFAERSPRPHDASKAAALLDQAGWTVGSDGTRSKDGAPLHLVVAAYPPAPGPRHHAASDQGGAEAAWRRRRDEGGRGPERGRRRRRLRRVPVGPAHCPQRRPWLLPEQYAAHQRQPEL